MPGKVLDELAGRAQPRARADHFFAVAAVEARLEQKRVLAALAVVVLHHDGVGGLGRAHRPVAEVEFGHVYPLWQCSPARAAGNGFRLVFDKRSEDSCPALASGRFNGYNRDGGGDYDHRRRHRRIRSLPQRASASFAGNAASHGLRWAGRLSGRQLHPARGAGHALQVDARAHGAFVRRGRRVRIARALCRAHGGLLRPRRRGRAGGASLRYTFLRLRDGGPEIAGNAGRTAGQGAGGAFQPRARAAGRGHEPRPGARRGGGGVPRPARGGIERAEHGAGGGIPALPAGDGDKAAGHSPRGRLP